MLDGQAPALTNPLVIKKCSVFELETNSNFSALMAEYADELAIDGLPHPSAKMEMYRNLYTTGTLYPFGAFFEDKLIGLINVLMVMNQHYGTEIAVSESYFVAKEYRKTGAGNKLRIEAENCAKKLNSPGFFISAPKDGPLAKYLAGLESYIETGSVFFNKFSKSIVPAMTDAAIDKVRELEKFVLQAPQTAVRTTHSLHGGVYTRTIVLPGGSVLTGALIKIATTLIVSGEVTVYVGDFCMEIRGYNVIAASAHRKQAFVAHKDTTITMIFATDVKTVEEAEEIFTDEAHLLSSRLPDALNHFIITGE